MDNLRPGGTEDQSITYPSGEALGRNVHVRRSEHIRKSPQQYKPGFGAAREWNDEAVASIAYMIQDGYLNSNVDTDFILSLLAEWDAEDCMDTPSMFHMRESYVLKSQSHDPDTPTYTKALSGKNAEEYFKATDDKILSLMRSYTWEIVLINSVADHKVLPGTWYFKCKSKTD